MRIRCSKTDPYRSGATIHIIPSGDPTLCAVTALDALVAATGRMEGPLFRLQSRVTLGRPKLTALIRELAACSGVATAHYSSHSFKIGAASAAAAAGLPEWRIQAPCRWSTDCYRRYVRLAETESDTVAAVLARVPCNHTRANPKYLGQPLHVYCIPIIVFEHWHTQKRTH